jgi:hypothetical protein
VKVKNRPREEGDIYTQKLPVFTTVLVLIKGAVSQVFVIHFFGSAN